MSPSVRQQVDALESMTVAELRETYARVFGEATGSRHKTFLRRRIIWGLQAQAEGGLSERAIQRAKELAKDADLRLTAPKGGVETLRFQPAHDRRLPLPGSILTRHYKGQTVAVTVLDQGFECRGEVYRSLTAVAKAITGTHWNGYHFFGMRKRGERR